VRNPVPLIQVGRYADRLSGDIQYCPPDDIQN
jgi:hypothetical protein